MNSNYSMTAAQAFEKYRHLVPRVLRYVRFTPDLREDLLNTGYVTLITVLDDYGALRDDAKLTSYLTTALKNAYVRMKLKHYHYWPWAANRPDLFSYIEGEYNPNSPTPEELVSRDRLAQDLRAALQSLTPKQREVIEKRFGLNGRGQLTYRELSEEFGGTFQSYHRVEQRALGALRKNNPQLEEYRKC